MRLREFRLVKNSKTPHISAGVPFALIPFGQDPVIQLHPVIFGKLGTKSKHNPVGVVLLIQRGELLTEVFSQHSRPNGHDPIPIIREIVTKPVPFFNTFHNICFLRLMIRPDTALPYCIRFGLHADQLRSLVQHPQADICPQIGVIPSKLGQQLLILILA